MEAKNKAQEQPSENDLLNEVFKKARVSFSQTRTFFAFSYISCPGG